MNKLKNAIIILAVVFSSTFSLFAQEAINVDAAGNVIISKTLNVGGMINTSEKICENGNSLIPRGVIVMWSGDIPSIPKGWVLCDGQNYTPDLRSRFIVGASASGSGNGPSDLHEYEYNDKGGEETHILSTAEMPNHTHSFEDFYWSEDRDWTDYPAAACDTDVNSLPINQTGGHSPDVDTNNGPYLYFRHPTYGTGGNGPHENRPPFYALAYIMKE